MHAEMPRQNPDGSANIGMQLWVDLPEKLKKCEPRYRDLRAGEIPNIDIDDGKVHVKIISGQSHGVDSVKELAYTPVWIFDIEVKPGGKIVQSLPEGWNAFAYTLSGSTAFGVGKDKTTIGQYHNVVFEQKGDEVNAEVAEDAKENGHFSKSCDFLLSRLRTTQKFVILRQYPSGELSSNIVDGSIDLSDPIPEKDLTKNSPEGLQFLKCLNRSIFPPPRLRDFDAESKVLLSGCEKIAKKEVSCCYFYCVRRESNPGPIDTAQEIELLIWQRWILPLNHKRFCLNCGKMALFWVMWRREKFNFVRVGQPMAAHLAGSSASTRDGGV